MKESPFRNEVPHSDYIRGVHTIRTSLNRSGNAIHDLYVDRLHHELLHRLPLIMANLAEQFCMNQWTHWWKCLHMLALTLPDRQHIPGVWVSFQSLEIHLAIIEWTSLVVEKPPSISSKFSGKYIFNQNLLREWILTVVGILESIAVYTGIHILQ